MSVKIPFVSLFTEEKSCLLDSIFSEFRAVIESSQFILGNPVKEFETEFSRLTGTSHAVGVNSGLDALILGLRTLGIGLGDEVITAPNSFIASAAAISLIGAKPVFVDVTEDFNLDPALIEQAITSRTKVIMPVHLTGNPAKMKEILAIAKKHQLFVIEDAAQSIGAMEDGKLVGSFGDISAFSLHPLKNLHVWGDGGMIVTNSEKYYSDLQLQRNHGLKNRDEVDYFSFNSRLDSLQAVVGKHFLGLLDKVTESRIHHANLYFERLKHLGEFIKLPEVRPGVRHVFHVFQIRVKRRDELKQYLLEKGIETKVHYPIPLHLQKASEGLGYGKGSFPVTEKLSEKILSLPVRENLSEAEIDFVCEQITKFYATND